jgi:hypothetical protein
MLQVDLNSWSMTSANNKILQHYVMFQKFEMKQLGFHVATLFKPLHYEISPSNLVKTTSTHKPTQHSCPTLTLSL